MGKERADEGHKTSARKLHAVVKELVGANGGGREQCGASEHQKRSVDKQIPQRMRAHRAHDDRPMRRAWNIFAGNMDVYQLLNFSLTIGSGWLA